MFYLYDGRGSRQHNVTDQKSVSYTMIKGRKYSASRIFIITGLVTKKYQNIITINYYQKKCKSYFFN